MILVSIALLLSILQMSVAPNALIASLNHKISDARQLPIQTQQLFVPSAYKASPELKPGATNFSSPAKAALIYDSGSGKTLYAKAENESLPMASLTKLMTAIVIMQNHSPDEIVTIPENLPALAAADQKIGVIEGEKFKLSELMNALLIYSANDVANSLAIWDSGSVDAFTSKMNSEAKQWGLTSSNFTNANGLDEINHRSSAKDLLILSTILLHNQSFQKIVNTPSATIRNQSGKAYTFTTTNKDLSLPYVYGIKTGLTDTAGQCLVLLAKKNGHEIITVVLNSPERFQDSKNMVDYTFNNYIWK